MEHASQATSGHTQGQRDLLIRGGLVLGSAGYRRADVAISEGIITGVEKSIAPEPRTRVIDAADLLLSPGLINGHFHSHEHFHKGRFDNLPLELWMHFVRPPRPIARLTPRQVYLRTMVGAIEALRTGTTFIVDDVNHSPYLDDDCIAAVFDAYDAIGLRGLVSLSMFDLPFHRSVPHFSEIMPPNIARTLDRSAAPDHRRMLEVAEGLSISRHPKDHRVGFVVAPSAPQRCSDAFLVELHGLAESCDLPMIMHLLETRSQAVSAELRYGCSAVEHLSQLGVMGPRCAFQHCVWLTPRDVELLAASGASAVYNPLSNLKLGSGTMPLPELLEAGVNVALATDGCGSCDSLNMLSVLQATALLHKSPAVDTRNWVSAAVAFRLATEGGAYAFGRQGQLGRIEVGFRADIVGYGLAGPTFSPLNDPLRQLVFAESGASVRLVLVDGEEVMLDGVLTKIDEELVLEEARTEHRQLLPAIEQSERGVQHLIPHYRAMLARSRAEAVSEDMLTREATLLAR